jgi:hypothetical protein
MEFNGKIIAVLPKQTGTTAKGTWQKQEFVVETFDAQYPKKACFNFWGDNVDKYPPIVGNIVKVSFDIDCREYNGKWYNDLRAWALHATQSNTTSNNQP